MYWNLNSRIWEGATVAVVGGGPSLKDVDLTPVLSKFRVIGVNDAYKYGVGVDLVYWGDDSWYWGRKGTIVACEGCGNEQLVNLSIKEMCDESPEKFKVRCPKCKGDRHATVREHDHPGHRTPLLKWPGMKVTTAQRSASEPNTLYLAPWVTPSGTKLVPPPYMGWYGCSGLSAIGLAVMLGASRVVLLGFDGRKAKDGSDNWHPDNVAGPVQMTNYARFRSEADKLMDDLKHWQFPTQIVNTCMASGYEAFQSRPLEKVLKEWE